jgi:hypothetical protein
MRKGADDDRDGSHRPRHNRNDSIPYVPARLAYLKSPDAATTAAPTPGQSPAIISTHRFAASIFSHYLSQGGKAMAAVHYYLGRPACVWISAHSPRSPARQAREGSGRVHSSIPGQPATGLTPSVPAAAHGSPDTYPRSAGNPTASVTAAPGLPPGAAPADGLLARRRIAIARFGTDVAAAGGIGPALAAGLDPAGYPVVPAGVPQAWERAQVYLGLCERYQELYQAQLAELHLLMAMAPGCSLPLPHRRPLTGPHTGYISLIRARRGAATRTTRLSCISAGTRAGAVVQGPHRSVFVADERKRPYLPNR